MNVAGLFKTNIHQDTVFYTTFSDTWNQYNTVIDAIYNRSSIPLTSSVATVKLSDVATLEEKEMLSNKEIIVQKDSVVLQKLSVQYKLPTQKEIKYDIFSINTLDKKITTSGGVINTEQINSYLPTHKTRVWTLTNKNSYITSKLTTYFPDYNNIHTLTYVKLASPVEFNYGNNFKDTLFYSHLYYINSAEGHTIPYVLGYDSNGYGIALKASDQVAYPTYLTRTNGGAKYAYKIDEFPVIPLRQAFYYAGMPVLYSAEETPNTRKITISVSEFGQLTPTTIWGDFGHSDAFASYTYYQKCYSYVGGKCTSWSLDANNAANKITVKNWIEPQTDILLTSDIVESAIGNYLSGPFLYGRTVVPINLIYELSRGKIYADLDANGNIVVQYNSTEKQLKDSTATIKLSELTKITNTNNIDKSYTFDWPPPSCGTKGTPNNIQSQINDTVNKKNILKTQNMLAKTLAFDIKVAHKSFESDGVDITDTCIYTFKTYDPVGICDMTATVPCSRGTCEPDGKCYDFVTHEWPQQYVVREKRNWAYGYVKLTSITAHVSTLYGSKDISWSTNKQYSIDNLLADNATYTLMVTLADPDPSTLFYNETPNILNSLFDPNPKKAGDISVTYDVAFDIGANAEIHIYCSKSKCHIPEDDLIPLEQLLSGFDVHIELNKEKSTFIPVLTHTVSLEQNIYGFKALANDFVYTFVSVLTESQTNPGDSSGWYEETIECGNGVICDILSSAPMQQLGLYSTDYIVEKPGDSRYYLANVPAQVRNNISDDTYYAIFHGYARTISSFGQNNSTAMGRISVIAKKPLTLEQINSVDIILKKVLIL